MRTSIVLAAAACAAAMGVALAQVEASSSTFFLDVDPGRYAGPATQRIALRVDDQPRHLRLSPQDEICLQLQRSASDGQEISAHLRVLTPEPHDPVVVKLVGRDISPGTFRSTPWGMLLRAVPGSPAAAKPPKVESTAEPAGAVGATDAPVCAI